MSPNSRLKSRECGSVLFKRYSMTSSTVQPFNMAHVFSIRYACPLESSVLISTLSSSQPGYFRHLSAVLIMFASLLVVLIAFFLSFFPFVFCEMRRQDSNLHLAHASVHTQTPCFSPPVSRQRMLLYHLSYIPGAGSLPWMHRHIAREGSCNALFNVGLHPRRRRGDCRSGFRI